ncbi:MAG: 2,3-bisphosphoglycerate-independent phosphoglycerate mutase [Pseudomonadales bacterium]|nr:2,3-bisphosphoglycerate-independent phosphoglycerate mutase [Pseudomonadales bacterium]
MRTGIKPVVLVILDGWGYSEDPRFNAIAQAQVPVWRDMWSHCPHTLVSGSGMDVGLPIGQMGNSEVGHTNLGAGRVVYQDLTRISKAIADGDFARNTVLVQAVDVAIAAGRRVHVLGLLSDGGVHSHELHIQAMVELAASRGARDILVHAFLDGRDTPPRSAEGYLASMQSCLERVGCGRIASLCGRYFAMDRDNNGARMQPAWDVLVRGQAVFQALSAADALKQAYARGENDEFVQATAVLNEAGKVDPIEDGDAVIFMNFRADRARQLTRALLQSDIPGLVRGRVPALSSLVQLTEYADDIVAPVAFPAQPLHNVLGEYLSQQGLNQLRIAETEKYAHVTFFFNGGRETPFPGEERILIPSPKVATFDLKPEMSAYEVTDRLVEAIDSKKFHTIICNYANGDQVGHTGIMPAAIKAVEAVDRCLGRLLAAVKRTGAEMVVTADHGNVECLFDESSGQALTAHTTFPVPFVYVGERHVRMVDGGVLADVAPTLLNLMGLPVPVEMTGHSLIELL